MADWISVKDRLPERRVTVLGYWPAGIRSEMSSVEYEFGSWWRPGSLYDSCSTPTHWVSLPEAPNG
jgi:hypothetical protein